MGHISPYVNLLCVFPYIAVSVASALGNQNIISMSRYIWIAVDNAV